LQNLSKERGTRVKRGKRGDKKKLFLFFPSIVVNTIDGGNQKKEREYIF
jgi:hypothetical protein